MAPGANARPVLIFCVFLSFRFVLCLYVWALFISCAMRSPLPLLFKMYILFCNPYPGGRGKGFIYNSGLVGREIITNCDFKILPHAHQTYSAWTYAKHKHSINNKPRERESVCVHTNTHVGVCRGLFGFCLLELEIPTTHARLPHLHVLIRRV